MSDTFCTSWAETSYAGRGGPVRTSGLLTRQSTLHCCDLPNFLWMVCHLYQREWNNEPFLHFDMSASVFLNLNSASKASIIWRPTLYLLGLCFFSILGTTNMALGREGTLLQILPCLVPCSHCQTWKSDHWAGRRNRICSCFAHVGMTASNKEAGN